VTGTSRKEEDPITRAFSRAGDRTRTGDPHLGKVILPTVTHPGHCPQRVFFSLRCAIEVTHIHHLWRIVDTLTGTKWGRNRAQFAVRINVGSGDVTNTRMPKCWRMLPGGPRLPWGHAQSTPIIRVR
jgi:hypothetical protein